MLCISAAYAEAIGHMSVRCPYGRLSVRPSRSCILSKWVFLILNCRASRDSCLVTALGCADQVICYSNRPHSIILASCKPGCKPGFRPGLQPGFRQVRAGLRHAFDMLSTRFRLFLSKTWSRTCCINLDMRLSLGFKQVCSWLSTCFRHAFDLLATCSRKSKARCAARFAAC